MQASNVSILETKAQKIESTIHSEVKRIIAPDKDYSLPEIDSPLVKAYVQKIEGNYNVGHAKQDTDQAIDLLYIAYNATPQEEGSIRVQISGIMKDLLDAQKASKETMDKAVHVSELISKKIVSYFPDWLDTRGEEFSAKASEDIKHFIKNDLLELAKIIEDKAASLQEELQQIASEYEKIIQKTVTITDSSEMVLSARLKNKEALRKEIVEKKAEQERLESLVDDLKESVSKFDAEAKALASRADTLETRSFIMSLVKMGTDMVAASLPAVAAGITTAMTGGMGFIGRRAVSLVEPKPSPDTNNEETAKDEAAEDIKRKTDISDKNKSAKLVKKEIEDLEDSIDKLNQEKTSLLEKKDAESSQDSESPSDDSTEVAEEVAELDKRIKKAEAEKAKKQQDLKDLENAVKELMEGMKEVGKTAEKISDQARDQAIQLRRLQMEMLNKVEKYEKAKREETANLKKITALLTGKLTEEESIKLTIQALNLSTASLKQMKSIIEEVAMFFKAFADFMSNVKDETTEQIGAFEKLITRESVRQRFLASVVNSTDEFFVKQTGEWNAVSLVSGKFVQNFMDGWSKLNDLSGKYITGDKLEAYLKTAADKITEIAAERNKSSHQKTADLDIYRKQIEQAKVAA